MTRRWRAFRFRATVLGVLLVLLVGCSRGAVPPVDLPNGAPPSPDQPLTGMTVTGPPATPPARICDNREVLDGPESAPPGAVIVEVDDDVRALTGNSPRGTTFWLAPGIHTFDSSVVPKDGNVYLGAPGAIIDGAGRVDIAFWEQGFDGGENVRDVTLSHLTIQNFASSAENQGSIYAGVGWKVLNSTLKNHGFVALFVGPDNLIQNNCFDSNGQLGIGTYRLEGHADNVVIDHNEFARNNTRNLQECGCAGGLKWWESSRGRFTNNWVHDNKGPGVWADNNNIDMLFEGNYINDNDGNGIFYEVSYNFMIRNNTIIRNARVVGSELNGNFPIGGIYISESGGLDIPGYQYAVSEVSNNYLEDNWDGVVLWESGNRYAGVDGEGYAPRYGDRLHWMTQNVKVHNNDFRMNKTAVGCEDNPNCGRNGLFSDWVPVPGPAESTNLTSEQYQIAVTYKQGNSFFDNKYVGPWAFVAYDHNLLYDWSTWRNPPPNPPEAFNYSAPGLVGFGQDAGSTFDQDGNG